MQDIINWVLAHSTVLAVMFLGIADFILAINPKLDANGVFHFIYLKLKELASK